MGVWWRNLGLCAFVCPFSPPHSHVAPFLVSLTSRRMSMGDVNGDILEPGSVCVLEGRGIREGCEGGVEEIVVISEEEGLSLWDRGGGYKLGRWEGE